MKEPTPLRLIEQSLLVASIVIGLGACAVTRDPTGMAALFPKPEQLEALATRTAPAPTFSKTKLVTHWQLAGPMPTTIGTAPHDHTSQVGALLVATHGRNPRVVRSGGLECAAREYGHFWLAHQAMPSPELATFIQARCGEPVSDIHIQFTGGERPGGASLRGNWRDEAQRLLKGVQTDNPIAIGAWSGEDNGRSVVVVATGLRLFDLEPVAVDSGADGEIELRGKYVFGVGSVGGYATRGAYGYSECAPVPGTMASQFHLRCEVDPADPTVLVELMYAPPEWMLAVRGMVAAFAPGKSAPTAFSVANLAAASDAMPRRDSTAMLKAINARRRYSGLGPLRAMTTQSAIAARLLPHYLAAMSPFDKKAMETVVLGMMAGWEVRDMGMIRGSDFATMKMYGTVDIEAAIDAILMTPGNRAVLLDPASEAIALATQDHVGATVTAALVTTYKFFRTTYYEPEIHRVLDRLDAERAAIGQPPVLRVQGGNSTAPLARACEKIQAGRDPRSALDGVLSELVGIVKVNMRGHLLQGVDLDTIQFPPELVRSRVVQIDIDIGHYQPKGSPWGTYFVLMVYTL